MVEVDVRGFSCPLPVVRTRKAMEQNPREVLSVLVETAVSKENVSRLAHSQGYSINVEEVSSEYRLTLTPPDKQESGPYLRGRAARPRRQAHPTGRDARTAWTGNAVCANNGPLWRCFRNTLHRGFA